MTTEQKAFYDFILSHAKKDKTDALKHIIDEAIQAFADGKLDKGDLEAYVPKILANIKLTSIPAVTKAMNDFKNSLLK